MTRRILSLALLLFVIGCHSQDSGGTDTIDASAREACESAGNYCGQIKAGCAGDTPVGSCGGDVPCCRAGFFCGERTCSSGNTCDTSAQNYCSGTTSSSTNCGSVACLGGCTCASNGTGCDCPACQRQDAGACDGKGGGIVYFCLPAVDQQGNAILPTDAGSCQAEAAGGFVCCDP